MTEVRKLQECSIPVGRKGSLLRFRRFIYKLGAIDVFAKHIACRNCRIVHEFDEFYETETKHDMDHIKCPGCQSEDLVCTQVEAVFYAAGAVA